MFGPLKAQNEYKSSPALNRQHHFGASVRHDKSFTCNPVYGDGKFMCPLKCSYCYTRKYHDNEKYTKGKKPRTTGEIVCRLWMPEILDLELEEYQKDGLPQHLKRVQINEAFEYYIRQIMDFTKVDGKDLVWQILEVFKEHWAHGNKWMVHLLTKSPRVLDHKDILYAMRHMVQVEISMISLDDRKRALVSRNAPNVPTMLKTIKELSDAGIFVRLMAMPFYGDGTKEENIVEAQKLWKAAQDHGAQAFAHKNLNYTTWSQVIKNEPLTGGYNTSDHIYEHLLVKSGNIWRDAEGDGRTILINIPTENWNKGNWKENLQKKRVPVIDYGYAEMNDTNWGHIYSAGSKQILEDDRLVHIAKKIFMLDNITEIRR